jgi:hypothetical protein
MYVPILDSPAAGKDIRSDTLVLSRPDSLKATFDPPAAYSIETIIRPIVWKEYKEIGSVK